MLSISMSHKGLKPEFDPGLLAAFTTVEVDCLYGDIIITVLDLVSKYVFL